MSSRKRTYVDKHPPYERRRVAVEFDQDEGRTHQSFRDQCDINMIFARFVKTNGELDHINPGSPMYGDFTDSYDLRESIERVARAQESFLLLPAKVKDLVNQDPARLLDAIADPAMHDDLVEAGFDLASVVPGYDTSGRDESPKELAEPAPTPEDSPPPKPSEPAGAGPAPSEA
jgi:hypothetical protein